MPACARSRPRLRGGADPAIDADLAVGGLPDLGRLRDRFRPDDSVVPTVAVDLAPLSAYDELATIRAAAEVTP